MTLEVIYQNLLNSVIEGLPNFLYAILTLVLGFIIGKLVGWIVKKILVGANVDDWVREEDLMSFKFSDVITAISKWIVYLVFIQQAAMILGVQAITTFVNSILNFIPGLIGSAIIIIVGYTLAVYFKDRIISSRTIYANMIGNLIFFLIVYLSVAMALPFVGINSTLVNQILLIIIASVGIGISIALGLGLKDVVRDSAKEYIVKFKKKPKKR